MKNNNQDMNNHEERVDDNMTIEMNDVYCIIKNKEDGFYWVINLEDHPGTFLLDKSYHNMLPPTEKGEQESMLVIQPMA